MGMDDLKALFSFVGGLGLFLYGMHLMAEGLQKSAGEKTRRLMGYLTDNRLLGVLVGALITAIIQSSSATTVMVVGFVNAGVLSLTQAVGVIMGANIGTTVTSWLVSMNEWGSIFQPEFFAPLLVGVGAPLLLFGKDQRRQEAGSILVGFGILFLGLEAMNAAVAPYSNAPIFADAFATIGSNPLLGILVGLVVTALIQSSSASLGILQTLAMNGIVTWNSAVFIALGQNIGTCVTAMISSIGANSHAKQAAMIHLLFNTIGALLFGVVFALFFLFEPTMGTAHVNSVGLAMFHTCFNLFNTVLLFPFADRLVGLSQRLVKEGAKSTQKQDDLLTALDPRMMEAPGFAIESAKQEVAHMAQLVIRNVESSRKAFVDRSSKRIQEVYANEELVNRYEKELTGFLVHIESATLSDHQQLQQRHLLYVISDLERISDRCRNLAELSEQMLKEESTFSIGGYEDLENLSRQCLSTLQAALNCWKETELERYYEQTKRSEQKVNEMENQLRDKHIRRLSMHKCEVSAGVIFLDAISYLERISDYAMNIANYAREEAQYS